MVRLYRDLAGLGPACATTIGNFDGVHLGHRLLVDRVVAQARELGVVSTVLTFDPHPAQVLAPERAPKLLTSLAERVALLEEAGIEQVFALPFDRAFSEMSPEEFAQRVLVDGMRTRAVVVGENFRFGQGQSGDFSMLSQLGMAMGFVAEEVPCLCLRSYVVSSSGIRKAVVEGDLVLAGRMLGRCYSLAGDVVKGFGIGSKQTAPTLNLRTAAEVLPANGVYVTRTRDLDDGRRWESVTNVGTRPTFDGDSLTIETYLLGRLEPPSPVRIRVEFLKRLRAERKFESPDALKAQIGLDVRRAQSWFRRTHVMA